MSEQTYESAMRLAAEFKRELEAQDAEIKRLRAALESAPCPRPFNGRPDEWSVDQCCSAHECGCVYGEALNRAEPLRPAEEGKK